MDPFTRYPLHFMRRARGLVLFACLSLGLAACGPETAPVDPGMGAMDSLNPELARLLGESIAAVEASPGSAELWLDLAMTYDANRLMQDALRCYGQAVLLQPGAESLYLMGRAHWELGSLEQAAECWTQVRQLEPDYAPLHWRLGRYHMDLADFEVARSAFERALELQPGDYAASMGLARCLLSMGEAQAAADLLEDFLQRNKRNKRALNLMARVLERLGRSSEAERFARRELKASVAAERDDWLVRVQSKRVGTSVVLEQASALMSSGSIAAAVELLQQQLLSTPDSLGVWNMLLRGLVLDQRHAEALELYEESKSQVQEHHLLLISQGRALIGLGRFGQARQSFQRALELAPGFGECFGGLGEALLRMGQHGPAADAFLRATQLEQINARDWLLLGQAELLAGRAAAALVHAQEALKLYPNVPDLLAQGVEAALGAGRLDLAQDWLKQLQKRSPKHAKLATLQASMATKDGAGD